MEDHDSEPIDDSPDDIASVISEMGSNTIKMFIILFIIVVIVNSDVFIDRVLSDSDGVYASGRHATGKGVLVQGVTVASLYVVFDLLTRHDYI
jgi:hypothetical protein